MLTAFLMVLYHISFAPPPPKKTHKEHVESNFKLTNYTIKMKTISHGKFYLSSFNILRVYFKP